MRALRLLGLFFWVGLLNELEYRVNFLLQAFQTLLSVGTALAGLAVVFQHTRSLGGWEAAELVVLLGVFQTVAGLMGMVIGPSFERLMRDVREGTLDFVLTKPVSAQFLVSIRQVAVWRLADVVVGLALVVTGGLQYGARVGLGQVLLFVLVLAAGVIIVYSFRLILATLTFWVVRVENIMVIFGSLYEAGRLPVSLYPDWLRVVLTFLVPVAFATTVPAEALTGRLTVENLALALVLAVGLFGVASAFWRYGLRHYTGASA